METFESADQAEPAPDDWEITHEIGIAAHGANLRVEIGDGGKVMDLP